MQHIVSSWRRSRRTGLSPKAPGAQQPTCRCHPSSEISRQDGLNHDFCSEPDRSASVLRQLSRRRAAAGQMMGSGWPLTRTHTHTHIPEWMDILLSRIPTFLTAQCRISASRAAHGCSPASSTSSPPSVRSHKLAVPPTQIQPENGRKYPSSQLLLHFL